MKPALILFLSVLSTNVYAAQCAEVGLTEVQSRVEAEVKARGFEVAAIQMMVASYDTPSNFVVLAAIGNAGAVAYAVKAHETETDCIVDSIRPTNIQISKTLRQTLGN